MKEEALLFLRDLAREAAAPQLVDVGDPRKVAFTYKGEITTNDKPPSPRAHTVKRLADLVDLANDFGGTPAGLEKDVKPKGTPVVWYDEAAVVVVFDDAGHRLERATLKLETSQVFAKLEELAKTKAKHDQRAFVRLLRIDLAGTLDPVLLLEKVRKVRFENGATTEASVGRQRESLGRSITSECRTDGGDLPEEVVLQVPVYQTNGQREPLPCRCSVEVDAAEGSFRLLPLPDELSRVRQFAVSRIADELIASLVPSVPCYCGTP